jgi:hypothetical protein
MVWSALKPGVLTPNSSRTALLRGIVGRLPCRAGSRGAEGVQGVMTEGDRRPARHRKRQVAPPTQPEERSLYTSDGRINPEVMTSIGRRAARRTLAVYPSLVQR